jgi:HSP20 family protein
MIRRMMEDTDRIFEELGLGASLRRGEAQGAAESFWLPQIEVAQRGDQLVVRADLPGLDEGDIELSILDDALVIEGERRLEREETREGLYRSERRYGRFRRVVPLPDGVDPDTVSATFHNGVLEVRLSVPEQRREGRRIEIGRKAGEGDEKGPGGESVH